MFSKRLAKPALNTGNIDTHYYKPALIPFLVDTPHIKEEGQFNEFSIALIVFSVSYSSAV